jgi:nitrite transporter NirC
MPIPISEALEANEAAAAVKARQARPSNLPRYLLSAMLAGAFIGVAVVVLLLVSTAFIAQKSPSVKLVQGAVFGIALTLVVFAGAELFTGNVMVMLQGLMKKIVTPADVVVVWVGSLLGNLLGALGFAALVAASGVVNAAPRGTVNPVADALAGIVQGKVNLTGNQLFFRAILCNFLVCLALWMATRTKSDAAKLICLWWALLAFVASGFEHSVANMTVFGLAIFVHTVNPQTHVHLGTMHNLIANLAVTVPGNVIGGGLLVGAAYGWLGAEERSAGLPPPVDLLADDVAAVDLSTLTSAEPVGPRPARGNGRRELVTADAGPTSSNVRTTRPRSTTPPPRRRP